MNALHSKKKKKNTQKDRIWSPEHPKHQRQESDTVMRACFPHAAVHRKHRLPYIPQAGSIPSSTLRPAGVIWLNHHVKSRLRFPVLTYGSHSLLHAWRKMSFFSNKNLKIGKTKAFIPKSEILLDKKTKTKTSNTSLDSRSSQIFFKCLTFI